MKKTITHYLNPHIKIRWNPLGKKAGRVLLTLFTLCIVHFARAQQSTGTSPVKSTTPGTTPGTTTTPGTIKGTSTTPATTPGTSTTASKKPLVATNSKTAKPTIKPILFEKTFVASITAGTTGFGAEAKELFRYNLNLRAGFSFSPQLSTVQASTASFDNSTTYSGNFSKAQVLLEYAPFKSLNIRLVGGAAYVFALKTNIDREPTGNYTYGDIIFTPSEIGTVHTVANWKGAAAYAGLSFFRIVPKKMFNITFDLGTYYLSQPQTNITGTNLLAVDASANNKINWHENISQYRWLPVLQVNYNFRLGKITTK